MTLHFAAPPTPPKQYQCLTSAKSVSLFNSGQYQVRYKLSDGSACKLFPAALLIHFASYALCLLAITDAALSQSGPPQCNAFVQLREEAQKTAMAVRTAVEHEAERKDTGAGRLERHRGLRQ